MMMKVVMKVVNVVMKVVNDLSCLRGFEDEETDRRTDTCECRVASATVIF